MKYYILKSGQQFGPYSRETLTSFLDAGEISAQDPAWVKGLEAWGTVAEALKKAPVTPDAAAETAEAQTLALAPITAIDAMTAAASPEVVAPQPQPLRLPPEPQPQPEPAPVREPIAMPLLAPRPTPAPVLTSKPKPALSPAPAPGSLQQVLAQVQKNKPKGKVIPTPAAVAAVAVVDPLPAPSIDPLAEENPSPSTSPTSEVPVPVLVPVPTPVPVEKEAAATEAPAVTLAAAAVPASPAMPAPVVGKIGKGYQPMRPGSADGTLNPGRAPAGKTYMVMHGGLQVGPYSPEMLIVEIANDRLSPDDRAWSTGMTEWRPISAILKEGVAARKPLAPNLIRGSAPAPAGERPVGLTVLPAPPDLHWTLVLLFGICTLGLFSGIWTLIMLNWTRKLNNNNNYYPFILILVALPTGVAATALQLQKHIGAAHFDVSQHLTLTIGAGILSLSSLILWFTAIFLTRSALVRHYNTKEPINLKLSGVMTFLFSIFYLQYHLSRIAKWKRTGIIP